MFSKIFFVTLLSLALAQYGWPVPNDHVVVNGRSVSACVKTTGRRRNRCHGIIMAGSGRFNPTDYFNGLRHATRATNGVGSFEKADGTTLDWDYSAYERDNPNRYKSLPENERVQACYDDVQKNPMCGNKYVEFNRNNNYCMCYEYGITECEVLDNEPNWDTYECPAAEQALVQYTVTEEDVGPEAEYVSLQGTNSKNCLEHTHNGKQCHYVVSWAECEREGRKLWDLWSVGAGGLSGADPIGCYVNNDNGKYYLRFNAKYFQGTAAEDWEAGNGGRFLQMCRCGGPELKPYARPGNVPQFVGYAEVQKSYCPNCDNESPDKQFNWACKYKYPGSRPALASELSPIGMYRRVGKGSQCADASDRVLGIRNTTPWGSQSQMISCIQYCYSDPQCVAVLVTNIGHCPHSDYPEGNDPNQQKDNQDQDCMQFRENKECIFYGTGSRYGGGDSGAQTPTKAKGNGNHVCYTVDKNWSPAITGMPEYIPYHHGVVPACRQFDADSPALDATWGTEADCSDYYGTRVGAIPQWFEPKFYYWFPTPLLEKRGMSMSYMITPCVSTTIVLPCSTGNAATSCNTCKATDDRTVADHCETCNSGSQLVGTGCVPWACGAVTALGGSNCATCKAQAERTITDHCASCVPGSRLVGTSCTAWGCTTGTGTGCATCVPGAERTSNSDCATCNDDHTTHHVNTNTCVEQDEQYWMERAGRCEAAVSPTTDIWLCERRTEQSVGSVKEDLMVEAKVGGAAPCTVEPITTGFGMIHLAIAMVAGAGLGFFAAPRPKGEVYQSLFEEA